MASKLVVLLAGLVQLQLTGAVPANLAPSAIQLEAAAQVEAAILADFNDRWVQASQADCSGQSCVIADVVGSTGKLPTLQPEGATASSWKCIQKFNPEGARAAKASPMVPKQSLGLSSALLGTANSIGNLVPGFGPPSTGRYTGRCAPNIVIFAKGTTEIGELGITVGPVLSMGLSGSQWTVVGVPYTADIAGDYCLGMPGGMMAKDMINQAAQKCPNSKIFVSGYSQGAMVAHIGVAYANEDAKAKVAGVVVFGDPMQGAKIKGYDGPIITYCNKGDNICTGNFELAASHLAYVGGPSTQAIAEMKKIAAGGGTRSGNSGSGGSGAKAGKNGKGGRGSV